MLLPVCSECHVGIMLKPLPPASGDFDEEGKLESFCTSCGYGYPRFTGCDSGQKLIISRRDVKRLIDKIFTRLGLPYSEKQAVQHKIFDSCKSREHIIDFLSSELGEDADFLNAEIAGLVVKFSSNR